MITNQGFSFWIWMSVGLAVVLSNLAWLLARGRLKLPALARLDAWPGTPALAWFATSAYLLVPPVVAWRLSLLSPYYMGVTENDWIAALGAGGGLAVLITALTLGGWLSYRRSLRSFHWLDDSVGCGAPRPAAERWVAPVSAALAQWHLAFYRAAAIAWVAGSLASSGPQAQAGLLAALGRSVAGTPLAGLASLPALSALASSVANAWHAQPVYWGSWLGLLLAGGEWLVNPFVRCDLRTPGRLEGALRTAGLAIATTALFALTRNLWLCLASSVVVEILVAGWFPIMEAERPADAAEHTP